MDFLIDFRASKEVWNFVLRGYLLLKNVNPIAADTAAAIALLLAARVFLDTLAFVSFLFEERYVKAICSIGKASFKIIACVSSKVLEVANMAFKAIQKFGRLKSVTNIVEVPEDAKAALLQIMEADGRKRKQMKSLLAKANASLQAAQVPGDWSPLIVEAMSESSGVAIKKIAARIYQQIA